MCLGSLPSNVSRLSSVMMSQAKCLHVKKKKKSTIPKGRWLSTTFTFSRRHFASSSNFSLVMSSFMKSYSASDKCIALTGMDTFLGRHGTAINTCLLFQYFSSPSLFLYNNIKNTHKYSETS